MVGRSQGPTLPSNLVCQELSPPPPRTLGLVAFSHTPRERGLGAGSPLWGPGDSAIVPRPCWTHTPPPTLYPLAQTRREQAMGRHILLRGETQVWGAAGPAPRPPRAPWEQEQRVPPSPHQAAGGPLPTPGRTGPASLSPPGAPAIRQGRPFSCKEQQDGGWYPQHHTSPLPVKRERCSEEINPAGQRGLSSRC